MTTALLLAITLGGWHAEVSLGPLGPSVPVQWAAEPVATGLDADFVVAWDDTRFGGASSVMVSLVQRDGGVPSPFAKFAGQFSSKHPSLASTGAQAALAFEYDADVYLLLINPDGTFRGTANRISAGRCPSVAVTASGGVVVFEESEIRAIRFAWDGTLVDVSSQRLSLGPQAWSTCAKAAAAPDGTSFAVVWREESGDLNHVIVPFSGAASAQQRLDTGAGVGRFEVAALGGDRWWVTAGWEVGTQSTFRSYELTLTAGLAAQVVLPPDSWLDLDVSACAPGLCLLARREGASSLELSTGLLPLDGGAAVLAAPIMGRANEFDLTHAKSGDALLVVGTGAGVVRALVTESTFTQATPEEQVSLHPAAHQLTSVGVLSDVALVAWIQPEADGSSVFVRRFELDGTAMDAAPVKIAGRKPQYDRVDVMAAGEGWLLGLHDNSGAGGSLIVVTRAGVVSAEHELPGNELYHLGFAISGTDVLVSAKSYEGSQWDPILLTFPPDGGVVKQLCQVTAVKEHHTSVAANAAGERLVVWEDLDSEQYIAGVRFTRDGQPLEASGFRISPVGQLALQPQVVSDGAHGFFVLWRDWSHLYAQHLEGTQASAPLRLTPVNSIAAGERIITVPGGALVTWADRRSGKVFATALTFDATGVHTTGDEPISTTGFAAWPSAGVGERSAFFAFSRANTMVNSMEGRVLPYTREPLGAACQDGWSCLSGVCDAGACVEPPPVPDAGMNDGDAGMSAGLLPDGGAAPRQQPWLASVGFACSTGGPGLIPLLLTSLLLGRQRRRRR